MDYDIAIVGAGPAGSTFARLAAGSFQRILLIDGQTEENAKPCGGLLAPDAQKILAHFDLTLPKSVLVDPQIFSVKTIDLCDRKICYYPRHYLNMDRYAFDRWLASLVPDSVEICAGRCVGAERRGGAYCLTISTPDGEKQIKARRVVGADGAGSLIRRLFFKTEVKRYVAIQQWFEADDKNPFYSCIFDRQTSESCSWSIYKNKYFIFGGCFSPKDGKAAFEEQKRRLSEICGFELAHPVKTEACMALSPRRIADFQTGKDGIYLIGEAAGFISPSSFEGISGAILSGSLLAKAFADGEDDKHTQRRYRRLTVALKLKLRLKVIKRWFMYAPITRRLIMKTGIGSITPMFASTDLFLK